VSAVPRRMRLLCGAVGAVVFGALLVVALTLPSSSTGVVQFGAADQVAVAGLGLILGVAVALLGRSRVDADADGVRVRNVVFTRELSWRAVRAVRFDRTSAWASLQLENGDEMAVLAVQAADREHAVRAVEGLRALHAAARANDPVPPPLLYPE
jgi:hypothetical protein